mgnify:CR=1 FL=1
MLIGFYDHELPFPLKSINLNDFVSLARCEIVDSQTLKIVQVLIPGDLKLQTSDVIKTEPHFKLIHEDGLEVYIPYKLFVGDDTNTFVDLQLEDCIFDVLRYLSLRYFLLEDPRYDMLYDALKTFTS